MPYKKKKPYYPETDDTLSICFLLKVKREMISETEILERMPQLQDYVKAGIIERVVPDVALSVAYNGKELWGADRWDYMTQAIDEPYRKLVSFFKGEIIESYLPMCGCRLTLTPRGFNVGYELKFVSKNEKSPDYGLYIYERIPTKLFITEFYLMYWRTIRLLNEMGINHGFLKDWESKVLPEVIDLIGIDIIRQTIENPLEVVILNSKC